MTLLGDPLLLAAVVAIVIFAAVVQAGLGMGFGLAAAPLLAVLDPELVPVPTLILGFVSSVWVAARDPGQVQWAEAGLGSLGRLAGAGFSALVLIGFADRAAFSVLFALLIGTAVGLSALGLRLRFTRPRLVGLAVLSGLMATITSVGAPPMALIYQDRPPRQARATLAAFFALGCAISLCFLTWAGWAGLRDLYLAAVMAPAMVVGMILGKRLLGQFDRRYRAAILMASGVAALVILARGVAA